MKKLTYRGRGLIYLMAPGRPSNMVLREHAVVKREHSVESVGPAPNAILLLTGSMPCEGS